MNYAEDQLATIGFAKPRRELQCWRAERLARREDAVGRPMPECSPALRRWRDLLARDPRPSPYRIAPA